MAHPQEAISFEENVPTQINVPPGTFYSFLLRTGAKPPPNHKRFYQTYRYIYLALDSTPISDPRAVLESLGKNL